MDFTPRTGPAGAPQPARLPELDALRGIAAFLVLIHHAVQMLPSLETPDLPGAGWLRYTLIHLTPLRIIEFGRPAVLFFFVLSGYVLTRALLASGSPGLTAFAAQRTIRLGLPVLASVLLSATLYFVFFDPVVLQEMGERSLYTWLVPPSLQDVITNALLIAPNDEMRLNVVLWSLAHEWRLTVLLPLVLLLRGRAALLAALVAAMVAVGIAGGASENSVMLGPDYHSTIPASLYFAGGIGAGVLLAFLAANPPRLTSERWLAACIGTVALFSMASDLAIYAGSCLLILVAMQPGRFRSMLRSQPAILLGRLSFSLYLVHVPVLVATLHALYGTMSLYAVVAFGMAAAILVAVAMNLLVEVPSRSLARAAERRLATKPATRFAGTPAGRRGGSARPAGIRASVSDG